MRVAIFTDSWFPRIDGLTTSVQAFKTELERRGHSFHVFASGPKWERDENVTRFKGIPFWGYPDFHVSLRPGGHDTEAILRDGGFDLVHIQSPFFVGLWGLRAARKAGLPTVTSYHTYVPDLVPYVAPRGLHALGRRVVWSSTSAFFARCDMVLAPSPSCAKELLRHVPEHKMPRLQVHASGVDTDRFYPATRSNAVRAKLLPHGGRLVLSVGRLAKEKDLPFVLEAFAVAHRQAPDLVLAIGGTGPDLERIRQRGAKLGILDSVRFLGFVPDPELPALYASAEAFVSASQFETQGMTAVEAMASGTPVAAVHARGLADYVTDGVVGHHFQPGDVAGAAQAILDTVDAGPEMRQAARRHAESLSLRRSCDQLESIYRNVLEVRRSTSSR